MTARDGHFEAVGLAGIAIQGFQNAITGLQEGPGREAYDAVATAVGADPTYDSAVNAITMTRRALDLLDEARQCLDEAGTEITRYSGGF